MRSWACDAKLIDIFPDRYEPAVRERWVKDAVIGALAASGPFHADSTPAKLWEDGESTPSVAFDYGFASAYLGFFDASFLDDHHVSVDRLS